MKILWICLGSLGALIALVILLLLFGKAKIRIAASSSSVKVMLIICGIRIWILPLNKGIFKKGKNSEIFKKLQTKSQERKLANEEKRATGEHVPNFLDHVQLVFTLLKVAQTKVQDKLRICVKKFYIEVASPDAAQTAILYGSIVGICAWFWEWVQASWAIIDRRRGAMKVYPNYLKTQSSAEIDIVLRMNPIQALTVVFGMIDAYKDEKKKSEKTAQSLKTDQA